MSNNKPHIILLSLQNMFRIFFLWFFKCRHKHLISSSILRPAGDRPASTVCPAGEFPARVSGSRKCCPVGQTASWHSDRDWVWAGAYVYMGDISVGGSEGVGCRVHDRVPRLADCPLRFDFELLQQATQRQQQQQPFQQHQQQQQQHVAFMACNLNLSWSKNGEKIKFAHRTSLSGRSQGGMVPLYLPLWAILQNLFGPRQQQQ